MPTLPKYNVHVHCTYTDHIYSDKVYSIFLYTLHIIQEKIKVGGFGVIWFNIKLHKVIMC